MYNLISVLLYKSGRLIIARSLGLNWGHLDSTTGNFKFSLIKIYHFWLSSNDVHVLQWPEKSLDLTIIKKFLYMLTLSLYKDEKQLHFICDLQDSISIVCAKLMKITRGHHTDSYHFSWPLCLKTGGYMEYSWLFYAFFLQIH